MAIPKSTTTNKLDCLVPNKVRFRRKEDSGADAIKKFTPSLGIPD